MSTRILVDGSNVLFWQGGQVRPDLPELVVRELRARRFAPVVCFDNSVRYHMGQSALEALTNMAKIMVAPAGTPADALLLEACCAGRHQIVSNDRFRNWRKLYPMLQAKWLVTGRIGKRQNVQFSKKLRPAPL